MRMHDARGRFIGMGDNTIQLITTLHELMLKPLDRITREEFQWVRRVHQERPAWAIATLDRFAAQAH